MQNKHPFKKIGIVGLGLIGGSLAKAFNNTGITIYGYDISVETLKECGVSGIFESVTDDFDTFINYPLDLIYITLPINASLEFIGKLGKEGVGIPTTDGASTKVSIIKAASEARLNFCGGHPIKGKETSGFKNSDKDLFNGATHILVPTFNLELASQLKVLHESIKMNITFMEPDIHDEVFGLVSHFPHLGAFTLMDLVQNECPDAFEFSGGGFKDFTRIAASDPVMWADIFIDNKDAMINIIDEYIKTINNWRDLIEKKDDIKLKEKILAISNLRKNL